MKSLRHAAALLILTWAGVALADGPADNIPGNVRQIPPPGIEIPADDRTRLQSGLDELAGRIEQLRGTDSAEVQRLLPDVEIFHRAVDQALSYNEMFAPADIKRADDLLAEGTRRAEALQNEKLLNDPPYWTQQKGLVVRGFRSKLDDTVQPYGLVIPPTYRSDIPYRYRTDIWFHGRGERSVELQFIHQRMRDPGQYQPEDTIVLHPFGRYSNAFKFAGEVDVFEALDHAKANYRIDDDRISVRGFSMGGAAAWHFAAHYADRWFAANPGAGFSETPLFLQTFQGEVLQPTWWEKTLWQWYDCPPWVTNLSNVPVIAYSGELDPQKQAADVMAEAFRDIGLEASPSLMILHNDDSLDEGVRTIQRRRMATGRELVHIVGHETAHRIHGESKVQITRLMRDLSERLAPSTPSTVRLVTTTLRHNRHQWITIKGLENHWQPGFVFARLVKPNEIRVVVSGVNDFEIQFATGDLPDWFSKAPNVRLDAPDPVRTDEGSFPHALSLLHDIFNDEPPLRSDRSWSVRFYRSNLGSTTEGPVNSEWHTGTPPWENELRKRHGLQGPIDDALMDSFVFVTPGGECRHPLVQEWTTAELDHAITHWRQQMRGDARVKADAEIAEEDIADHNLILWGDPASNSVLARIADQLPIRWGEDEIVVGERRFDAEHHAPILIYPNPLNPQKYVVLNSSFTYREYDYLNNARQTPKLPDWAIVDLRVKPDSRWPGKIVDADFFDEKWQLQKPYRERTAK
jgi:pimeloyl-ACP methyl ester carboxylesterase